jgi:predicted alpha/beta superfamily hydrolase
MHRALTSPSAVLVRLAASTLALLLATTAAMAAPATKPSTAQPNVVVLPQPFEIASLHRTRTVRLYLPPSYATAPAKRYPVIYMHDGQNLFDDATSYAGEWGVDESMNELARTKGFEAIVVGIDNGGEHRNSELTSWANPRIAAVEGPQYMAFVVETLKPWIDAHYRTLPGRESTAMIGSSLGGLVTHYALLRYPQVIGKAGILSPSYWISQKVYDDTKAHPWPAGTRTWFYIGGQEDEEAVPDVERMLALLATQPHPAQDIAWHVEPRARHNEQAWRVEFPRVVAWLFELPGSEAPSSPRAGTAAR